MPVPQDNVASIPEARRVFPFPVLMRLTARKASSMMPPLRIEPPSRQAHFILERAPPGLGLLATGVERLRSMESFGANSGAKMAQKRKSMIQSEHVSTKLSYYRRTTE